MDDCGKLFAIEVDTTANLGDTKEVVKGDYTMMTDEVKMALKAANKVMSVCLSDYSHPNFTDRHDTETELRFALQLVRSELAKDLSA